jgi:uncharacterized membrane protein (UPF0182 family)
MPGPAREPSGRDSANPNRRRWIVGIVVAALVLLALSLRAIATFWTDFLWFDQLDLSSVWSRLISARVTLGAATGLVFFVLLWVNLVLADRLAPRFRANAGPEDDVLVRYRELVAGRQRLLWLVVSLVIAIVPAFSASAQWRQWVLFRYGGDFGVDDPQFSQDLGWYVFKLPFLTTVVDWLFAFLIVVVVVTAVVHYLNGAIRLQPLGERVTPNAKAHLSVLLALAAFTKAVDYWLRRYELVTSGGGSFDGAGYTDVNAALPAIQLMILISIFAGVLLLINIRRKGWALPVIILALWGLVAIIAGGLYPAFVQRFQVEPAELAKERPYIERNIEATRAALDLDAVEAVDFDYTQDLTEEMVEEAPTNLENARLLDPTVVQPTITDLQVEREYYTFRDVDVDRYDVDGERTPVVVSSRELNLGGVTAPTWEKLHLVFTHGYAAALAPSNSTNDQGEPDFLAGNIPATTSGGIPPLLQPELYHGEDMEGYSIVGTSQAELSTDEVEADYDGEAGVPIDSTLRRAAFALRFGEIEPLISGSITDESKVIYQRDVVDRVREIAPFLEIDPDPYPVLLDDRVQYVVDAYTTTSDYPYAQSVDAATVDEGSAGTFNYLRNSVKALVDAYDGTVTLYLTDELYGEQDPIIRAYAEAFPDLFTDEIPDQIQAHFRYPEFLFKTQTSAWGRYHQSNPSTFFNNSDRWVVAPRPSDLGVQTEAAEASSEGPIDPYYQEMVIGTSELSEFVLTRPFVLSSGDGTSRNLTSVMIARNDPENYGELEEIIMVTESDDGEVQRNNSVDGPVQANRRMVTNAAVAEYQNFVGRNGSRVRFGNILILPVENALVYLRPVYAAEEGSSRFTLQRVVVASGEDVGFGETVDDAMQDLLDSNPDGTEGGEQVSTDPEPGEDEPGPDGEPGTTTTTAPAGDRSATELIEEADALFAEADERLADSDLAGYEELMSEAVDLVRRAGELLSGTTSTTSTTAPPD